MSYASTCTLLYKTAAMIGTIYFYFLLERKNLIVALATVVFQRGFRLLKHQSLSYRVIYETIDFLTV